MAEVLLGHDEEGEAAGRVLVRGEARGGKGVVMRKVRLDVKRLMLGLVMFEFGEYDGEERGRVAGGSGGVLGEDLGVVGYSRTVNRLVRLNGRGWTTAGWQTY